MSNIDERIQEALAAEEREPFDRLDSDATLFQTISDTFHGKNRRLVLAVYVCTMIFSGLLFWTAYRFFMATDLTEMVRFGVSMLACLLCVTAYKQWSWMEMNRVTLMRELKRAELRHLTRPKSE